MIKTQGIYHIGIPVDSVLGRDVAKTGTDDREDRLGRVDLRSGKQHGRAFQVDSEGNFLQLYAPK